MVRVQHKKVGLALADFAEAIRLDRSFALAYYCRGCALGDSGQIKQSIADLNEFIALQPGEPAGYFDRTTSWYRVASTTSRSQTTLTLSDSILGSRTGYLYRGGCFWAKNESDKVDR